jgi:hypothetical protein
MSGPDAGTTLYCSKGLAIDVSAADFDCTDVTKFAVGFVTEIYIGTSAPGDLAVVHFGDTVAVTFKNVIQGSTIKGCFKTIKRTGTTVTNLVARSL